MSYISLLHRKVALVDFGIYNWKRHSTGFLMAMLRNPYYKGYEWKWEWIKYHNSNTPEIHELYWYEQWIHRIKDELNKRPHQTTKRERQNRKKLK